MTFLLYTRDIIFWKENTQYKDKSKHSCIPHVEKSICKLPDAIPSILQRRLLSNTFLRHVFPEAKGNAYSQQN